MKINNQLGNLFQIILVTISIGLYDCFKFSRNNNYEQGMNKLSDCSAKFDDGSILDLSSLDNSASPL